MTSRACRADAHGPSLWLVNKTVLLGCLIALTNPWFVTRLTFLASEKRLVALAIYVAVWAFSVVCIGIAAYQPRLLARLALALPIALATGCAYGYYRTQGGLLQFFDVMTFWSARHEAGRAMEFYGQGFRAGALAFALTVALFAMPTGPMSPRVRRSLVALAWLPLLPVAAIAGILVHHQGRGVEGLPEQFTPLSLAAVAAYKIGTGGQAERGPVTISAGSPLAQAIVIIVDESVRADRVSLVPGNAFTPELAGLGDRWIDFGPAGSGANCSHFSNALLRFMADRYDVPASARSGPTLWHYARQAGFRTVFIDAQAGFISDNGKLQNFMTAAEAGTIDRIHLLPGTLPAHALDDELMNLVLAELREGGRVLIYANKNGAHFPYERNYPGGGDAKGDLRGVSESEMAGKVSAYDRAVRWTVDRVMARFTREADLGDAVAIYTSDHGQHLAAGRQTHCTSGDRVEADEGIVPLMVSTGRPELQRSFRQVSGTGRGYASHFDIAPTVLRLMGYDRAPVLGQYGYSLLDGLAWKPSFVSDDILGMFGQATNWHSLPFEPGVPLPAGDAVAVMNPDKVAVEGVQSTR